MVTHMIHHGKDTAIRLTNGKIFILSLTSYFSHTRRHSLFVIVPVDSVRGSVVIKVIDSDSDWWQFENNFYMYDTHTTLPKDLNYTCDTEWEILFWNVSAYFLH